MIVSIGLCYNRDMKNIKIYLYYIIFLFICIVAIALPAVALSKEQESTIMDHCESIKDNLRLIQKNDSRTRVYLGGRYESILNKYVMPLNVSLVENSMSTANMIESQNVFTAGKTRFANDYVNYQQRLEELVSMDCKNDAVGFYEKLEDVRTRRKKVEQDVQELRKILDEYVGLVVKLKERLNEKTK